MGVSTLDGHDWQSLVALFCADSADDQTDAYIRDAKDIFAQQK